MPLTKRRQTEIDPARDIDDAQQNPEEGHALTVPSKRCQVVVDSGWLSLCLDDEAVTFYSACLTVAAVWAAGLRITWVIRFRSGGSLTG
jgi:hypothetical protein